MPGAGAILLTGASASVKGYKHSAPFAMGKFALRGLAQSIARELAPQGIHVAHFVIDGAIRNPGRTESAAGFDAGSRRDRAHLPARAAAGAQRLDLGGRAAPVGRELLAAAAQQGDDGPGGGGDQDARQRLRSDLPAGFLKGASACSRASRAGPGRAAPRRRGRRASTMAASSPASRHRPSATIAARPAASARRPRPCRQRPRRRTPRPASSTTGIGTSAVERQPPAEIERRLRCLRQQA